MIMCCSPRLTDSTAVPVWFFIIKSSVLICCTTSCVELCDLHAQSFSFFCALFNFNYRKEVRLSPPCRLPYKGLRAVEIKEFYFIADLHKIDRLRMNKDVFTQISMQPHITYSDTRYLLCSTFFPHTKLSKTHSVDFHPRLYILFSVRCQRLQ